MTDQTRMPKKDFDCIFVFVKIVGGAKRKDQNWYCNQDLPYFLEYKKKVA